MIVLGIVLLVAAFIFKLPPIVIDLSIFLIIVGVLLEVFGGPGSLGLRGHFRR